MIIATGLEPNSSIDYLNATSSYKIMYVGMNEHLYAYTYKYVLFNYLSVDENINELFYLSKQLCLSKDMSKLERFFPF